MESGSWAGFFPALLTRNALRARGYGQGRVTFPSGIAQFICGVRLRLQA